ncbi:hypothetical protein ABB37_01607 [Leptomonas pyrrhocoris]|uniref:Uncharacterized protein n=1 Tax=Leptomonas pyrrhocoris TaxID=157538 RepID=A0A0M9G8Y7_LEPPY|nr:hypothetical protein ABB37_01607 [Leptomonas pyrrhocoris]KPA85260.1 hypothetical protein ABB37_01607 [Leptomonas pyrrhocoris]|eukprot:XP_015663699.1 hypothetical protein ABB37_01607 [Leptomonas pyrrhocoris]
MPTVSANGPTAQVGFKLNGQNSKEFWNAAWEHDATGWRQAEQRPVFTRNLYVWACNSSDASDVQVIPRPCVIDKADYDADLYNGPTEEAVVTAFLQGKSVLVPLCGDTAAVRYMADHGATLVVGADLAPEALRRQRETHLGDVRFVVTSLPLPGSSGSVTVYEGVKGGCTIRLFEGDFLALAGVEVFCNAKIDFVYDRASMMAMHPSMRSAYVATIAACLTPEAGLMVERPVRDEGDVAGPPFTFSPVQVLSLYNSATGRSYDVETVLVSRWYGNPDPGNVHYFDFLRVFPKKT